MVGARGIAVILVCVGSGPIAAQSVQAPACMEMEKLVETERAFVRRAQETNWRDAFLEYFADGVKGFEGEDVKERLRSRPAPPRELEFWWEPRFGDIAASGDLGWLTGPVRTRLPQVNGGNPAFANYVSVWKRQPDGTYRVIEDVGVDTPRMVPFAPGFSRAPVASRYAGSEEAVATRATLADADRQLNASLRRSQADAYATYAAPFARLHRRREMPIVGDGAIVAWAEARPAWTSGDTQVSDAAESGDLGYTRGAYAQPAAAGSDAESGYYLRIWSRDAQGNWRVVLDVAQPKR
jgi:ketosteroid isomerase-like protein